MGSTLVVPRVGTLIAIRPDAVNMVNGSPQIRITHNRETDAWNQVGRDDPGFIVWLSADEYRSTHNTVRIYSIAKTGTSAWGKSLFIQQ